MNRKRRDPPITIVVDSMQIPDNESRTGKSMHRGFPSSECVTERVQVEIGFLFRF